MKGERPVQVRLALVALVMLVGIVAALGCWQVLAARDSQGSEIKNSEVTAAHLASRALASALQSRLEVISNLAEEPNLAGLFTPSKLASLSQVGVELHLLYPSFAGFYMVGADGRLDFSWPPEATANVSRARFFRSVMGTGQPYVSEALKQDTPPHELVVGLSAPVRSPSGKIVGILEGSVSAASLASTIGGLSLGGGGHLVIVDRAGHALSGPAAGGDRSYRAWPLVRRALEGRAGSADGRVPGFRGARLVGYATVPTTGWAVIAEASPSLLDSRLAALTVRLIAIGLIVLLLAIGSAVLVASLLRRLTRAHQRVGAILSCVGEGVATVDPHGYAVHVNPALGRLAQRAPSEMRGRPWDSAFSLYDQHGEPVTWESSIVHEAVTTDRVVASSGYDVHLEQADGKRTPVAITAAPLVAGGELLGGVVVVRDVSHEREVDQLKSSLVSTVSHELRTPLTMIQGFAELLLTREDLGDDPSRQAIRQVHSSAERLGRLIDDLLSVSRIDSGKLSADLGPVDLPAVIGEVVTGFATGGERVEVDVEPGLPHVLADHDKMVQVVTNLLSNALKYSQDDSTVRISAKSGDNHVELSVADEGIGMSEEESREVFEKFSRVDRAEVRKVSGTGLGLYITKSLVELQHGQLWVRSQPGAGSTFSLSLPLVDEGGEASPSERVEALCSGS